MKIRKIRVRMGTHTMKEKTSTMDIYCKVQHIKAGAMQPIIRILRHIV
jgi:hypothetical protein